MLAMIRRDAFTRYGTIMLLQARRQRRPSRRDIVITVITQPPRPPSRNARSFDNDMMLTPRQHATTTACRSPTIHAAKRMPSPWKSFITRNGTVVENLQMKIMTLLLRHRAEHVYAIRVEEMIQNISPLLRI
jgi:hypothetical protein